MTERNSHNTPLPTIERFDPLQDAPTNVTAQRTTPNGIAANGIVANGIVANGAVAENDARRAQQLLDRAFALWEKGDTAGAILSCRQSLKLAPHSSGAYSMLGLLLERKGDVAGAIEAYEKAVAIEPSSLLERDSARRLRAANRAANAPIFHFEADEISAVAPTNVAPTNVTPISVPASSTRSSASSLPSSSPLPLPLPLLTAAPLLSPIISVPVPVQASVQVPVVGTSAPPNVAVAAMHGAFEVPVFSPPTFAAPNASTRSTSLGGVSTDGLSDGNANVANLVARWRQTQSFWMRSVPLLVVAGTSFLFLLWARGVAVQRERPAPVVVASAENGVANAASGSASSETDLVGVTPDSNAANANPFAANASSTGNHVVNGAVIGGVPSTNGAIVPPANAVAPVAAPSAAPVATPVVAPAIVPPATGLLVSNAPLKTAATSRANRDAARAAVRERDTRRSVSTDEPRARRSRNENRTISRASDGALPGIDTIAPASVGQLRPVPSASPQANPQINPTVPSEVQLSPSLDSSGAAQSGDSGSGDSANGGIRKYDGTLPRFPPPARVRSNQMREHAATTPSGAQVEDTAYNYQLRALTFVEQGNNARAATDFQTAMTLYRRQIARGVRVDEAQRGLDACRKGLRLVTSS